MNKKTWCFLATLMAIGCVNEKTSTLATVGPGKDFAERDVATVSAAGANGLWGPMVHLKDLTYNSPGDMHHPRPSTGWWYAPIHATLLKTGEVVITGWVRAKESSCEKGMGRAFGTTFVLNPNVLDHPASNIYPIQPVPESARTAGDVMYCSGHSPMADGRVFFVGGATYENLEVANQEREYGLNYARIFDPARRTITRVPAPSPGGPHPTPEQRAKDFRWYQQGMMWYPTVLRLPNDTFLVAGGLARQTDPFTDPYQNRSLVLFDPSREKANPWTVVASHEQASPFIDIRAFDYPHLWLLPKAVMAAGRRLQVLIWGGMRSGFTFLSMDPGMPGAARFVNPPNGLRRNPGGAVANGSDTTAALLGTGEVMMMGGGQFGGQEGQRIDLYNPQKDTWRSFNTGITRVRAASTLLPDGTVLILNGERSWNGDSVGDRRQPTIFDPFAGTVTNLAPWSADNDDRGYHNFSLLLRDGRILLGGGRTSLQDGDGQPFRIGCERSDIRIYEPPYLFRGPRPIVTSAPSRLTLGGAKFNVGFSGARLRDERAVVLMALGSETHHFDQNQRYIPLSYKVTSPGIVETQTPADSEEAPEGDYFLYLISADGVPSLGQPVHLDRGPR